MSIAAVRDFGKLDPKAQADARRNAVAMVKSGMKRTAVAKIIGVNRRFVGEWVDAEAVEGSAALEGK